MKIAIAHREASSPSCAPRLISACGTYSAEEPRARKKRSPARARTSPDSEERSVANLLDSSPCRKIERLPLKPCFHGEGIPATQRLGWRQCGRKWSLEQCIFWYASRGSFGPLNQ